MSYNKNLMPPERLSQHFIYSITFNYGNDYVCKKRIVLLRCYIELFKKFEHYAWLKLYPELSKTGVLHYHGFMCIKKDRYIPYIYDIFNESKCRIKFDTFDGWKWVQYITKQRFYMEPYFSRNFNCFGFPYKVKVG